MDLSAKKEKMKIWQLRFMSYKTSDDIFDLVISGEKTIETRPATKNFKVGDRLVLTSVSSGRKIEKEITYVHKYASPERMLEKEDYEKIFPGIGSKKDLLEVYKTAKKKWGEKYKFELENYGIVAIGFK